MNFQLVFILICVKILATYQTSSSTTIECEKIVDREWTNIGTLFDCWLHADTIISWYGFEIGPANENVTGLSIQYNKKVEYLPEKVHLSFPKLRGFSADGCAIRKISKINFKKLNYLRALWLRMNEIEVVPSNSFEDLISLEYLVLGK
jgi:hypothetical protein